MQRSRSETELDPAVFTQVGRGSVMLFALLTASPSPPAQCKELLRPVKKWLTVLQSPPAQGGKEEVLQQYKKVGGAAPPVVRQALC